MTENEYELIKLIRENDNPEKALMTATAIILDFLSMTPRITDTDGGIMQGVS